MLPAPVVLSLTRVQLRVNPAVNLYFVRIEGRKVVVRSNCIITVGDQEFGAWDTVPVAVGGVFTVGNRTFAVIKVLENGAELEDWTLHRQRTPLQVAC